MIEFEPGLAEMTGLPPGWKASVASRAIAALTSTANLQIEPEKFSAEKISLVAQLGHGDDSLDAVLDLPAVAGGFDAAQAATAMLEINRSWNSGALSSKRSGAADLNLAKGWLEWPEGRTEVRLRDRNKPEVASGWQGVTRFDAVTFAVLPGNGG